MDHPLSAVEIVLRGHVQGLGVRPAVVRWARRCGVRGRIRNRCSGVWIEALGEPASVERFCAELTARLPAIARVDRLDNRSIEVADYPDFSIVTDEATADQSLAVAVPNDRRVATMG